MSIDLIEAPTTNGLNGLIPQWVKSLRDAELAGTSEDRQRVWIVSNSKLTAQLVRSIAWPGIRAGFAIIIGPLRSQVIPALSRHFERVAFVSDPAALLPKNELIEVLALPDRNDRFIGVMLDPESKTMTLWRGDLLSLVVPFSAFSATANGIRPDFNHASLTDFGHTIRLGDYEAASDSILYDFDPDFRRRLNRHRKATERTLGASIRRLRRQRELTRNDFPGIDPKTLARIERNEVTRPHADTLKILARRLGTPVERLASY
jgi:hypothetical protein